MTKKTIHLILALTIVASCCISAQASVSSTKSYTLSVTIPQRIEIPSEEIKPIDLQESISKYTVKEYNIRFIEITEIVLRDEPIYLKTIVLR